MENPLYSLVQSDMLHNILEGQLGNYYGSKEILITKFLISEILIKEIIFAQ